MLNTERIQHNNQALAHKKVSETFSFIALEQYFCAFHKLQGWDSYVR
ncbi:hypothetical Protein YC6258_03075 [Gynuella sunshinyii YC6258]|uniref:Uncharacterized protein n=1 Tax=Gynuella sunshinyii YC6258 TaxID=1445510 RepID=A0A0C5VLD2_9GAMM|nr:hypothetical Protein YC6258_03075 [Gynuella sunshinyii YC6258]